MNVKNLIIGKRSNLSKALSSHLPNSIILSTTEILEKKFRRNLYIKKNNINLIINSFFPSNKLNQISNFEEFINKAILDIIKILNVFPSKKINKIIFTSSASVNSLNKISLDQSKYTNREIYSLTKILCEKIIIKFSKSKNIQYIITRPYNIYGGNESFSMIYKIIKSYQTKKILTINNNGEAIRDFIHVDDVAKIYKKLIKSKSNTIHDVGNGYGYKIKNIISSLGIKNFEIKNKFQHEENISIAKLENKVLPKNFKSLKCKLNEYLKEKIQINKNLKISKEYAKTDLLYNNKIQGAIIYGAGNAGKQVCNLILKKNINGVFCFIDDDPKKIGTIYKGKSIISRDELKILAKRMLVPSIIIAIPSLNINKLTKLFNDLYNFSSSVYNLPIKSEFNTDQINLSDLQKSELIHVFKRNNLKITKKIFQRLENKKILVTGAGGSIGSELVYQLSRITKKKIICLDFSELFLFKLKNNVDLNQKKIELILGDINDNHLIKQIIKKEKIDIIFHAAAYKHLNFLEKNPIQAIKNNILGTYNLIESANSASKKKIKMINISTDKAVNPTSMLGISKRIAEIICQNYKNVKSSKIDISTVRFGNVFGSKGSVVSLFLEKINKGENVEITSKRATRYFMSVNEACNLVITTSQLKNVFTTYILDMGEPVNIYNLLKKIIKLKSKYTDNFKIKINKTKLQKGEKISEELSLNKKLIKTSINKIFQVKEPIYSFSDTNILIENIKKNVQDGNYLKINHIIKKFLKNEFR